MKPVIDPALGALAVWLLRAVHWMDRRRSANFAGAFMRKAGPLLKEHRLGRENLRAAYPEKSDAEIEKILGGVWDNLGRVAVEFAHLDEFSIAGFGPPTRDVITYTPETAARFERIMSGGQAMIGFGAHLANWEIPAVGATKMGIKSAAPVPAAGNPGDQQSDRQVAHAADGRDDPDHIGRTGAARPIAAVRRQCRDAGRPALYPRRRR